MSVSELDSCIYAYEGKLEDLTQLLTVRPEFLNKRDINERAPIHWATSAGNTDVVKMLLEMEAEMNEKDDSGIKMFIAERKRNLYHSNQYYWYLGHFGLEFYEFSRLFKQSN